MIGQRRRPRPRARPASSWPSRDRLHSRSDRPAIAGQLAHCTQERADRPAQVRADPFGEGCVVDRSGGDLDHRIGPEGGSTDSVDRCPDYRSAAHGGDHRDPRPGGTSQIVAGILLIDGDQCTGSRGAESAGIVRRAWPGGRRPCRVREARASISLPGTLAGEGEEPNSYHVFLGRALQDRPEPGWRALLLSMSAMRRQRAFHRRRSPGVSHVGGDSGLATDSSTRRSDMASRTSALTPMPAGRAVARRARGSTAVRSDVRGARRKPERRGAGHWPVPSSRPATSTGRDAGVSPGRQEHRLRRRRSTRGPRVPARPKHPFRRGVLRGTTTSAPALLRLGRDAPGHRPNRPGARPPRRGRLRPRAARSRRGRSRSRRGEVSSSLGCPIRSLRPAAGTTAAIIVAATPASVRPPVVTLVSRSSRGKASEALRGPGCAARSARRRC